MIGDQPSSSMTSKVNDAYLIPALSKMIQRSQAISLKGKLAKEVFANYQLEKLLMAFVQNKQGTCAILGG
jgi:hypothetical protein